MTINIEGKAGKYGMPTAAVTIIATVFAAGMAFSGLVGHRTDASVHMTDTEYDKKFDSRLELSMQGIRAHNRGCAANFTRIEEEQKAIKTDVKAIMTWLVENK